MKRSPLFAAQLAFTLLVCAFMLVPVVLSLLAGVTRNYFLGLSSGLTFDWLIQVWQPIRRRSGCRCNWRWPARSACAWSAFRRRIRWCA